MISSSKKEFIVEYRPASIRVARVSALAAPITIEAIEEISLEDEADAIANSVRKLSGAKSNGYLNGCCVVYPERRVVRQVSIDAPKGKETEFIFSVLHDEIENAPPELSAHCLSPETGQEVNPSDFSRKEVIICGVPNPDIEKIQKGMLENAIYPRRIELGTVGLIGAMQNALAWKQSKFPALMIEVDERSTNAVIIGVNGVEMSRKVLTGTQDIADALKEELNLKDDAAAERLLSSKDFDFSSISRKILRKLLRELQSSIGYYEVQTGQSVSWIHSSSKGVSMDWLELSLGASLNLKPFELDFHAWLESLEIRFADEELASKVDVSWMAMLSALCSFGCEKDKEEAA
ncbi:MAG TPA: hypothetical protein DIV79_15110 [Opitutae bacterium]|nr:hypothetical protein [Opitutaceae bacterium]HCR31334.1 hypothetical protein [Opitutae bacterium]|tara:strand:+ start:257 stop:1300 length:1044 start_codon:yes stop_codon:yes gene_type:complete